MSGEDFWKAIDAWRATYEFRLKGRQWRITSLLGLFGAFGIIERAEDSFTFDATAPFLNIVIALTGLILSVVWIYRDRAERAMEQHWLDLAAGLTRDDPRGLVWSPDPQRVPAALGPYLAALIFAVLLGFAAWMLWHALGDPAPATVIPPYKL